MLLLTVVAVLLVLPLLPSALAGGCSDAAIDAGADGGSEIRQRNNRLGSVFSEVLGSSGHVVLVWKVLGGSLNSFWWHRGPLGAVATIVQKEGGLIPPTHP